LQRSRHGEGQTAFAAAENAGKGVVKVDGGRVGRLHLAEAERPIAI
jgi:citrate lyase beta subunit